MNRAVLVALAISVATCEVFAGDVIRSGTQEWVHAGQTGRSDLLILGDSVTWVGGNGWDAGFIRAGANTLGLAGTGLMGDSIANGEGEGYAAYGSFNGWDTSLGAVPADKVGYVWYGPVTAGATSKSNFGIGVTDPSILDPRAAYDLHLYTDSPSAGTLDAYSRLGTNPYTIFKIGTTVATAPNPNGLTETTFSFAANPAAAPREVLLTGTTNTTVFYSRLTQPGAKGITVSSWGYGGRSTLDFLHDLYTGGTFTPAGRRAWLDAMVDGGSGKLNIVIAEGFNDRNETKPSATLGITDADSPEAFVDNISSLLSTVRQDWVAGGHSYADLSFTLLGMYQIQGDNSELRDYAGALEQLALSDEQISFVDLYNKAPAYDDAVKLGYFLPGDGIHLSRAGSLVYGQLALDAIIPEPSSLGLLAILSPLALMRRRR